MRAINHALTGAVIGLALPPVESLILAPISHYILDAVPHFGSKRIPLKSRAFAYFILLDAILCLALVVFLIIARPDKWLWACIAAFLAAAPDFMWLPGYWRKLTNKPDAKYGNWLIRLHHKIQWYEKPLGGLVEIAWLVTMLYILIKLI